MILVECTDLNKNLGNWHPIKAAKFFSTHFTGITNIKPAGSKKIKISFDSITKANLCLTCDVLLECGFTASIPSNLIFFFGIIRLDSDVLEDDFLDGVQSCFPIVSFKRISVKKDGNIVPTRIVELKFLSPKLPNHISIYNMIFDVNPSIRSPVQRNCCLRYGHTQKFCRSDPRCSHCGASKHSISECPTVHATDPSCLFCKLPHVYTDRSCQEWSAQKDIKKIMATENISYNDVLVFKKNKCYSTANTFSDIVKSQPPISEILKPNTTLHGDSFPSLYDKHHFFNSGKQKHKARPSFNKKYNYSPFEIQSYSPNDIIGVEVVLSDSSSPLKVWSCYLPSSSNIPVNLWQDLFTIVTQNTLLCGDFNAFHPAWGSDLSSHRGNLIYNTINSLDLCILNDGSPTHVGRPGSSNSAIDLSFCSSDISWYLSWHSLSEPHGSDHIPIIVTAKINRLSHFTKRSVNLDTAVNIHSSFNFNKANWSSFSLQAQNSIASLTNNNPSILYYSTLTSIINNSAESSTPRKRPNSNSYPPSPHGGIPFVQKP
ncbi:hypothetical protein QTP88_013784 [Uroleucon formosanum]